MKSDSFPNLIVHPMENYRRNVDVYLSRPTHVCVFVCVDFQILKGTNRINMHYYMLFSFNNMFLCINRCSI